MSWYAKISPIDQNALVITVADAKQHCNVDYDDSDAQFTSWIKAATEALQRFTNQAFLPSNVVFKASQRVINGWSNNYVIPFANNAALPSDSKYTLTGNAIFTDDDSIDITYTSGADPEEWMKQAVRMYVADLSENRGESQQDKVGEAAKQYCKAFINHGSFF
ncbi:MAG: phage gp6-like head-tail connector protein [Niabella sp.]|nr:phage gp6-like head-tail connector protein [Niabella sp.]